MDSGPSLAPLALPNFRWFFIARAVNLVGTTMAPIALAFAVLEVSNSASALGIVLAANTIPMVLFLLFGGVLSDRLPRVLILRLGSVALAATQGAAATLVITGRAELWMLVILEALNGIVLALTFPAFAAITPQLVPRAMLQQANVLQSVVRGALERAGADDGGLAGRRRRPGLGARRRCRDLVRRRHHPAQGECGSSRDLRGGALDAHRAA